MEMEILKHWVILINLIHFYHEIETAVTQFQWFYTINDLLALANNKTEYLSIFFITLSKQRLVHLKTARGHWMS